MHFLRQIREYQALNEQEAADRAAMLDYIQTYPATVNTRACSLAHLTASSIIINPARDAMLMVHHNIYNTWTWTGGHADGVEDLYAKALEEAAEESGLEVLRSLSLEIGSLDILPVRGHYKNGSWVSAHLHLNAAYIFEADDRQPLRHKADENSAVRWIPLTQVAEYSGETDIVAVYDKLLLRLKHLS
ncbi:MAG: NUDIX domain-containing protein [Spirochaetes bacterium]|nr:NUDIX domain-containing protein [Spirochaetota bacterium]MBU0956768.1 NUDIX domain-containing protein [Spirochaetota bacterium]